MTGNGGPRGRGRALKSVALDRIREMATTVCKDRGIELFDVEIVGGAGHSILRVYIDDPLGVSVEDCAAVSREMSTLLDVADPIQGRYRLEVSSPGIDRPIRHTEDARGMIGKLVRIKTRRAVEGRKAFKGRLREVRGDVWIVTMDDRDYEIGADDVEKANMIYEFD